MKYHRHAGKRWGREELDKLARLRREGTPSFVISMKLGRSN